MQESKENIKSRMLRNAARAWGLSDVESESNFDPLVSMLLAACSVELEKISTEIYNSRARVLERLVQLLSPDTITCALPAHSIACATPVENIFDLSEDAQFYINRKLASLNDNDEPIFKDIFFTPTANFHLNKASVRFIATGNSLYRMSSGISKELVAQSVPGKELPACSLWLGIDNPGVSLKNSIFYFNLRNEAQKQLFYHQLPKATWYWNDQQIKHIQGYGNRFISGEQLDLNSVLNRDDDVTGKIKKQINAFYKPYFITLLDDNEITKSTDNAILLSMIAETFTSKPAQILQKHQLRWICIDFPQIISSQLLEDVVCTINCFPVINRKMHEFNYRIREVVNIVPLQTEDLFLDLESVSNNEGDMLNINTFQNRQEEEFGVLMRNGGVGRFDERDAASIVDYLVQLLRDESAAFSALGNDFMNNEMKQIQQVINKLEQRLDSSHVKGETIPYLMLRNNPKNPWRNIFIRYWSTCGTEANNIKADGALRLYQGSSLENNQALLVATTQGGRNRLSATERVLAYKSALLSKERLITNEDIKAFCHYQLGTRVNKIEIEKGVMIHQDQLKGFMKTIDVVIDINRKDYDDMKSNGEIAFWIDNLKLLLEEKSLALLPYRIFIREAA